MAHPGGERLLTEEDAPQLNESVDTIIVVEGLPKAPAAKLDKLVGYVEKKLDVGLNVVNFDMPLGDDGETLGFAFVEYENADAAQEVVARKDGTAVDRKHNMAISLLRDFDRYMSTPEEWQAPPPEVYDADKENLWSWMLDEQCRDQYVTREEDMTEVYWNLRERAISEESREGWSAYGVAWSPKGTYLATFHPRGIALFGGPKWTRLARFAHNGVRRIDISPSERYLVTLSNEAPDTPKDPQGIIVWDIKTGQKKRGFPLVKSDYWPVFRWSHDDKYFAKLGENLISVYETPHMGLLNKRSIKIPGVVDFRWSPSDNYISYWTPEEGARPARIIILSLPSREEIAARPIYSVKECKMTWQESGDFLCVQVDRYTRSRKQVFTNFELFHLREKLVPCDSLEVKDRILDFAWEPVGSRFCIIHAPPGRTCVSFYQLQAGKVSLLKTFDNISVNAIFWSPRGQYCVLAGLGELSGNLSFVDCSDMTVVGEGEHFKCTDIEWDPTGRYVVTVLSNWRYGQDTGGMDTGYLMWSFQGRLLRSYTGTKFYQLLWRPKAKSLLSDADLKKIKKDFARGRKSEYAARFESEDKLQASAVSGEELAARRKKISAWESYRRHANKLLVNNADRGPKRPFSVEVETLIEETSEIVPE